MSLFETWGPLFRDWARFHISAESPGETTIKGITMTIDRFGVMVDDPTPEDVANKYHFCATVDCNKPICGGSSFVSAATLEEAERQVMVILGVVCRSIDNSGVRPPEPKEAQLSFNF